MLKGYAACRKTIDSDRVGQALHVKGHDGEREDHVGLRSEKNLGTKVPKNQKPERKKAREGTIESSKEVCKPVGGCLKLKEEVSAASSYSRDEGGLSPRETEMRSVV